MKLFKEKPKTQKIKIDIEMPVDAAELLAKLKEQAKEAGYVFNLSNAVSDFVIKEIAAADRKLNESAQRLSGSESQPPRSNYRPS